MRLKCACGLLDISIHAPRAGSDRCSRIYPPANKQFQSTLPVRGATLGVYRFLALKKFQSTLPVRGATSSTVLASWHPFISIHAPRAGSDNSNQPSEGIEAISIHAPRAGSDSKNLQKNISLLFVLCKINQIHFQLHLAVLILQIHISIFNPPFWCEGDIIIMGSSPSHH